MTPARRSRSQRSGGNRETEMGTEESLPITRWESSSKSILRVLRALRGEFNSLGIARSDQGKGKTTKGTKIAKEQGV